MHQYWNHLKTAYTATQCLEREGAFMCVSILKWRKIRWFNPAQHGETVLTIKIKLIFIISSAMLLFLPIRDHASTDLELSYMPIIFLVHYVICSICKTKNLMHHTGCIREDLFFSVFFYLCIYVRFNITEISVCFVYRWHNEEIQML